MWIFDALRRLTGRPEIDVSMTLGTGYTKVQTIRVLRTSKTADGIFGALSCDYTAFRCVTVENLAKEIQAGRYRVVFDVSPRLGYMTPHILDLDRDRAAGGDAGLRIHKANEPSQLEGCIALGTVVDGDAVDWSEKAFNEFMLLTDKAAETWLEVTERYA